MAKFKADFTIKELSRIEMGLGLEKEHLEERLQYWEGSESEKKEKHISSLRERIAATESALLKIREIDYSLDLPE